MIRKKKRSSSGRAAAEDSLCLVSHPQDKLCDLFVHICVIPFEAVSCLHFSGTQHHFQVNLPLEVSISAGCRLETSSSCRKVVLQHFCPNSLKSWRQSNCTSLQSGFRRVKQEVFGKEGTFFFFFPLSYCVTASISHFISIWLFWPKLLSHWTEHGARQWLECFRKQNKQNPSCWECSHMPGNWNAFITFTIYSGLCSFQWQPFVFGSRSTALGEVSYLFICVT